MKGLSDYKGEEAIELWADLLEPVNTIMGDEEVVKIIKSNKKSPMQKASAILKSHRKEAEDILLRIDPSPLNGLNIVIRLVSIIVELGKNDDIRDFFGFAEQVQTDNESSGDVTESTGAEEK